jgi:D-inositol-3-phosphate glycosyltransferase
VSVADAGTRRRSARIIVRRVLKRVGARYRRTAHAMACLGPGRVAGVVLDATLSGRRIEVSGWARAHPHEIAAVLLEVDGVARGIMEFGLPTPLDVTGVPVTKRPAAGWAGAVELADRTDRWQGEPRVAATVVLRNGLADHLGGTVAHRHALAEIPLGHVDWPGEGAVVDAPLAHVGGWIRHDVGFTRIEASFDGGPAHRARILSRPRPDLARELAEPTAELAGWDVWVPTPEVDAPTQLLLRVVAFTGAERHLMATRRVTVTPSNRHAPDQARLAELSRRVRAVAGSVAADAPTTLLVVTHHLGLGGGQLYLHELLRHLLAEGDLRCHVFAQADGPLRHELESWGVQVHIVGTMPIDGLAYEARMLELVALAAAGSPGVLMANTAGTFWGVDLATRLGIGSVWAIHESFDPEHFLSIAFDGTPDQHVAERFRRSFAEASTIVYEAGATKELFAELTPPERAIRLDYGIDLERIASVIECTDRSALRRARRLATDAVALVCVGTLEPRKGQGVLAAAFARVADEFPSAELFLIGDSDSGFSRGLHRMVDSLALAHRVHFVPITSRVDDWYLLADVFVLASDIESLPTSALEAMAFGLPVVASRVFGLPELICDGKDGFLFEPNDIEDTAEALRAVLRLTPDERVRVGEVGQTLIRTTRSSRPCAVSYRRLIDQLMADPRRHPRAALVGLAGGASHD